MEDQEEDWLVSAADGNPMELVPDDTAYPTLSLVEGAYPVRLGRKSTAQAPVDVVLLNSRVSSRHCSIWLEDGKVLLHDEDSENGTFRNATRLCRGNTIELKLGDTVGFPAVPRRVFFLGEEDPPSSTSMPVYTLQSLPDAGSDAGEEVVVVGERTREQRDAEGRKRAIDLDGETAITGPAAKKARTTASSKDKAPKDKVSRLFNMLSMYVSDYAQLRGGDFRPLLDQNGSERFDEPLTEDELDEVAYPFPFIYFKEEGDGGVLRGWSARFDAPNGKFFTVKDLVTAVARFGRCQWGEDGHVFFEGLRRVNVQTYIAVYGS